MKREHLRSKEVNKKLEIYELALKKKDTVELVDNKVLVINNVPSFFYHKDHAVPTLRVLQTSPELLKKVVVDLGAVKHIASGADIMRPGVVEVDEGIKEEDFVAVVDEKTGTPLVVGIALYNSEEMKNLKEGKVVKNIHYVGDEIWQTD